MIQSNLSTFRRKRKQSSCLHHLNIVCVPAQGHTIGFVSIEIKCSADEQTISIERAIAHWPSDQNFDQLENFHSDRERERASRD